MQLLARITLLGLASILVACTGQNEDQQATLFEKLPAEQTGIDFMNTVQNTEDLNIFSYRNFYNGGGVAIGDINNDGLADVFFTHNTAQNRLYLNQGNFKFKDITNAGGVGGKNTWSTGVVLVDVNADGWLDIYVCNAGYVQGEDQKNELYINNGDLTFSERAAEYGLDQGGYTTHAAFFDYDLDGDLDVYILNNSFMPVNTLNYSNKRELKAEDWPVRDFLKGGGDKMLRNDNGLYVDVTEDAGIYSSLIGFGLGVTVGDVNGDLLPDMYVSNDFFERDYLYINQGDGTFSEEIKRWIEHLSLFSMGADMADINNDGYPEIFVTDMLPDKDQRLKQTTSFETYSVFDLKQKRDFYNQFMHNTLQLNNRDNTFSEIAFYSGVAASDWSWGALMFDMDNDGYRDIYVCNGIYQDVTDQDFIDFFANEVIQQMALTGQKEEMEKVLERMPSNPIPNKAFRNMGGLKFEDVSNTWGFHDPSFSNGAAYGDLDNDGDLDLVINNLNQEAFVYRNTTNLSGMHYLGLNLVGSGQNPFAIGASAAVHTGHEILSASVIPSRGFQSSGDYKLLFGLGSRETVDSIVITWPDRRVSRIGSTPADTVLKISHASANALASRDLTAPQETLLSEVQVELHPHREDDFADFYFEGLIAKKLSREGPVIASGDINGDGTIDLVAGGAAGQAAEVYIQQAGTLVRVDNPGLKIHLDFEDTAAALFDADGDGDLDLYLGSGGNHHQPGARNLLDRLYMNNGQGQFEIYPEALPQNGFNTSVALPLDYDGDGDPDLVVCSRSIPNNYGVAPPNYLLQNDGSGHFSDVTSDHAPALSNCGLVTGAVMADVLSATGTELVLVGEWMAPLVFARNDGKLELRSTSLDDLTGWWYAVDAADLDGDGDQDLVLGNLGENFYLQTGPDNPVRLWLSDFDDNGTVENIITRSVAGKDVPVAMKKELTEQLPQLKKQNIKHVDYAQRSIQELFDANRIANATVREAVTFSSYVAWNEGNGSFTTERLPAEVQLSCVYGIECIDLNGDGHVDVILGGNDYGFAPQFSRLDGSFGHVLVNQGDRSWRTMSATESGLFVRGQIRQIEQVAIADHPHLLVAINNDTPRLYRLNGSK